MNQSARLFTLLALAAIPVPALHAQAAAQNSTPPAVQASLPPPDQKFRDGLYAEEALQDLDTAANAYTEIIAAFDRDRATAASALFRLGEVHRKQNRPTEAIACFRRLLQEFADREPLARLAGENLKALGAAAPEGGPSPAGVSAPDISLEEAQELARLQGLLKNSPDLLLSKTGGPDGKGVSAFLAALRAGHLKVTEFLLANGADPNRTPESFNPLSTAAVAGHKALVELLLARGADINGSVGRNPVTSAMQGNAATILKLLIERGADLKKADAVIYAVNYNNTAMLKLILDAGADPNGGVFEEKRKKRVPSSYSDAMRKYAGFITGPGSATESSLEEVSDSFTPLQRACILKNPANAALLLEKGADVNARSKLVSTALELAVVTSQPELVDLLIKAGADAKHIAPGGPRLTDLAAAFSNVPIYQLLRKAGAEVGGLNPAGQSIWEFWASSLVAGLGGTEALASALLDDGVEFNNLPDDINPLSIAVGSGNLALTKLCLAHGGDAKRPNRSPLPLELILGSTTRNYKSVSGITPNPPAAGWDLFPRDEIAILRTLIEAGADLNAVNQNPAGDSGVSGLTALHQVGLLTKELSVASLEKFLALHPDPHIRSAVRMENPGPAVIAFELMANYGYLSSPASPAQQRLWDYTWLENTPERNRSAWINQPASGTKNVAVAGQISFVPGTFTSIPPGSIAEVLVQHLGKGGYLPDLAKVAIHRFDDATGKTSQTEALDLIGLANQGQSAPLPKLLAGDILDLPVKKIAGIASWRDLPDPLPAFLRKATTRRITLTAGDWKRTFQVRPPLENFRWDPSLDVLSVEPTLASLLRFAPQPDFTYQMNAVAVKRAGQTESQILDLKKNPEAGQSLSLADGDEVILASLPADDPGLKERMAQGIFVSRAGDGFLREILHNSGAPPEVENKVILNDIKGIAYGEQDWILPHPEQIWTLSGKEWPADDPLPWGVTLEVPRRPETTGIPWVGIRPGIPPHMAAIGLIGRDTEESRFVLYRARKTFLFGQDGIRALPDGQNLPSPLVGTKTLYIKNRSLAALADEISPDKSKRGVWELRSRRLKEPLRLDLKDKQAPFILLENDDTLLVDQDEPLPGLEQGHGTTVSPALPPSQLNQPAPPPKGRRAVILPPK